jgi:hypothetical protein
VHKDILVLRQQNKDLCKENTLLKASASVPPPAPPARYQPSLPAIPEEDLAELSVSVVQLEDELILLLDEIRSGLSAAAELLE